MSQNSKIEWTQKTWNPVTGCSKVSQGCKNCYAEVLAKRFWKNRKFTDVQCHPDRLEQPLHWRKPATVFVNSMSDLFHEDVPFEFIDKVFGVICISNRHTFQILTKRPERALEYYKQGRFVPNFNMSLRQIQPNNIWLGVSVEDQKTADERIPLLLQIPAAVRFLSCEPLLCEVDLTKIEVERVYGSYLFNALTGKGRDWHDNPFYAALENNKLHWVICGGESGHGARPMHPDWARKLRDDCKSAGVPFFFKQWGEYRPFEETAQAPFYRDCNTNSEYDAYGMDFLNPFTGNPGKFKGFKWMDPMESIDVCGNTDCMFLKMSKKHSGRLLDGVEWNQFPNTE